MLPVVLLMPRTAAMWICIEHPPNIVAFLKLKAGRIPKGRGSPTKETMPCHACFAGLLWVPIRLAVLGAEVRMREAQQASGNGTAVVHAVFLASPTCKSSPSSWRDWLLKAGPGASTPRPRPSNYASTHLGVWLGGLWSRPAGVTHEISAASRLHLCNVRRRQGCWTERVGVNDPPIGDLRSMPGLPTVRETAQR